jgi:hypothetical protein
MTDTDTDPVPMLCNICHVPVLAVLPPEGTQYRPSLERTARTRIVHDACFDAEAGKRRAAEILLRESERLTSWQTLCPLEYRKPLDWKFKGANRSLLSKVLAWTYGERGLLVSGDNGHCKTRFLWQLLRREWDAGRGIIEQAHAGFRMTVTALAASDQRRLLDWLAELAKVEILFIDDLGKGRATPASEEGIFNLLDARMRACLPILFTTDMALDRIEAGFSDDYARGVMRRILERCEQIEF